MANDIPKWCCRPCGLCGALAFCVATKKLKHYFWDSNQIPTISNKVPVGKTKKENLKILENPFDRDLSSVA